MKTLVIFNPELMKIEKSYKVKEIDNYSFRDDRKYFYTIDKEHFFFY